MIKDLDYHGKLDRFCRVIQCIYKHLLELQEISSLSIANNQGNELSHSVVVTYHLGEPVHFEIVLLLSLLQSFRASVRPGHC